MTDHAYQQYIDAMPGFLTVQNRELKILHANEQFTRSFGDWKGRYCYQVYKQRPEKCEVCPVRRTFQDGEQHHSESTVHGLNGREYYVLINTVPVRNDGGDIVEVMKVSTDITDLKAQQDLLRDSQAKYRLLFEEVPCYISIQDRDLNIVQANRMHRDAFGTSYGSKCFRAYKHREEECLPCIVRQTFQDGDFHMSEEVVTSEQGEQINVLVHTAPIKNMVGAIDRVIEMSTDITQIRALQDKLTSIGLLIGSISHTIKGLLNGLDGGIYLVNTGLEKDNRERVEQGWEIAIRNVDRIRTMVLNILYYAKDRELVWEPLDVAGLAAELCTLMQPKAKGLQVDFSCDIEASAGTLEADMVSLRSVFVNILENALDACRMDTKPCRHTVRLQAAGNREQVVITITDNGIGMNRETREKAFSLFFSSKGAGGTGLGLFVAHQIIKSHGGAISIESQPGHGTSITITLPRKRPEHLKDLTELEVFGQAAVTDHT